jgi:hypothetical protein
MTSGSSRAASPPKRPIAGTLVAGPIGIRARSVDGPNVLLPDGPGRRPRANALARSTSGTRNLRPNRNPTGPIGVGGERMTVPEAAQRTMDTTLRLGPELVMTPAELLTGPDDGRALSFPSPTWSPDECAPSRPPSTATGLPRWPRTRTSGGPQSRPTATAAVRVRGACSTAEWRCERYLGSSDRPSGQQDPEARACLCISFDRRKTRVQSLVSDPPKSRLHRICRICWQRGFYRCNRNPME